ncbi:universal stress protein [Hymenobacter jeollabukensis]|uniref:Universal stress protein n=1 Tax=Hymenobacter jeollabukensis TaxID=2025313 RepID=A0A5R8WX88_9BACT|nr:universal stress protein [Hymenobacter jeollabukensis]TLM96979.1 universal stress protein [Hymenobacter jeollabukensis]
MTLNQIQNAPTMPPAGELKSLSLIVLTNFFPAAHRAVRYAAELAAPLGAQLVLLHVREVSVLDGELLDQPSQERDGELLMAVQALADEVYVPTSIELVPDLQLSTAAALLHRYTPAVFVLGQAAEVEQDAPVSQAVLDVLRSGEFPLLIVPEAYRGPAVPTHALVAADGDPFRLEHPGPALQLLKQLEPRLTVATVSAAAEDAVCATALRQVHSAGLAATACHTDVEAIRHQSPVGGLLQAVAQTPADLLVLIARRHSFLSALFHRSVTSRLLRTCPVPMLLLPAAD